MSKSSFQLSLKDQKVRRRLMPQKAFCDKELSETNVVKADKTSVIDNINKDRPDVN